MNMNTKIKNRYDSSRYGVDGNSCRYLSLCISIGKIIVMGFLLCGLLSGEAKPGFQNTTKWS